MQEIENVCVMFQYANPQNMKGIQAQLAAFFQTSITSRAELHEQLARSLNLMQFSKREIVHTLVQSHLKSLLTTKHTLFQTADLVSLLESLGSQMSELSTNRFILSNFVQLNAIICTLGWTISDEFEQRYTELLRDAEEMSPAPFTLPSVLSLLQEVNPETSVIKGLSRHRKTAVAFRDSHLFSIFKLAFMQFKNHLNSPDHITENALSILNSCLGFDFLGYSSDQDGMTSATQIPSNWKSYVLEENMAEVLISSFATVPASYHQQVLEVLGYLMGIRRSLFNEGERITYAQNMCTVATKLLSFPFKETEQTGNHISYRIVKSFVKIQ
jgi:hypothetical protein